MRVARVIPGVLAAAGALALSLFLAGAAQADQRYASPGGSGTECSSEKPCELRDAIEDASEGDEVIVRVGTYPVFSRIRNVDEDVAIRGDLGGPMPKIVGSTATDEAPIELDNAGQSLEYLDISNTAKDLGAGVKCFRKHTVNRVRVTVLGERALGIVTGFGDCAVRNSLVVAEGKSAAALYSYGRAGDLPASFENVTAIAQGPESTGLFTTYFTEPEVPGSYTAKVRNSIVQGSGYDIYPSATGPGPGRIEISNSNFDTVQTGAGEFIDEGGNQAAPPQFVDSPAGDFREAAGSPTIDAGSVLPGVGPLDLAGNPRTLGDATDIGAYEFVPPVPLSPPPAPAPAVLQSLKVAPNAFRVAKLSEAVASAKKKKKAPVGTKVTYFLSAATTVPFTVERKLFGRRVGGRCVKRTKASKARPKCTLLKPVKGGFSHTGTAGQNTFTFTGQVGSKALAPGAYLLKGTAGASTRTAPFRIVR